MKAFVFPGQGAQFVGMGKDLYENNDQAKKMFETANEVLGFRITDLMFDGTEEDLKQTKVTQPAVFLHSVILAKALGEAFNPDMVAGHSLGEFSALTAVGVLPFEQGLQLVETRALAMQRACEITLSTMAAIIGLDDKTIEDVCAQIEGVCVPANYNSPGQVVISGGFEAIEQACARLKEAGAKRALPLKVGGAFHSPLMEPARAELAAAIEKANFASPMCPIYQNVDALPHTDPSEIKDNLLKQLTAPVRWSHIVTNMAADGMTEAVELGPGNVLQGLVGRTCKSVAVSGFQSL